MRDLWRARTLARKTESEAGAASALNEFTIDPEKRHQELLELIPSESGLRDNASTVGGIHEPCCSVLR
jgi:hypothetical protein